MKFKILFSKYNFDKKHGMEIGYQTDPKVPRYGKETRTSSVGDTS